MAHSAGDRIVQRKETQIATIQADPYFKLFNLCHPTEEVDDGFISSPRFSLSDVLHLQPDSRPQTEHALKRAVVRSLAQTFGDEALSNVDVMETSNASLSSVSQIFSDWVCELYAAVENGDNEPYEKLDQLRRSLVKQLQNVFRPDRAEIQNYISRHRPYDILDHVIGWLEFDDPGYSALIEINGRTALLNIDTEEESLMLLLPIARAIVADIVDIDRRCRIFASEEYFSLYNGTWQREGEPSKTPGEFQASLALGTISIASSDECDFWYDDGGMFWGHSIRVTTDSTGVANDASLEG